MEEKSSILVVEDERIIRNMICTALTNNGYQVDPGAICRLSLFRHAPTNETKLRRWIWGQTIT